MEAIYQVGGSLDLVVTLQDDLARGKAGRIYVDQFAATHRIQVAKIRNINDPDAIEALSAADLDWLFIIGWSQIARDEVLAIPRKGVIGMHPTLLPIGRGWAAIPWAILKRLEKTGVTMFKMDSGVDTGPILDQLEIPLSPRTTATDLYARVNEAHVDLMKAAFPKRNCSGG
jgi:methionyl-tRNA formyltransferase